MTVGLLAESVMLMLAMSRSPGSAFVEFYLTSTTDRYLANSKKELENAQLMKIMCLKHALLRLS